MTRATKIGYSHAALTTAWFSTMALDTSQSVNGVLGDDLCLAISTFLALPLSWVAAFGIGNPMYLSMTEHLIWAMVIVAVVIVNWLVVGYCLDRLLSWMEMLERKVKQAGPAGDEKRAD
jgi:hypothetical protein